MSFSEIIGHKNVINFLEKSVKNDQVSHAYLFYGPKHLGKRTIAEKFVEILLGQPVLNHPDVYFVRREKDEKEEKMTSEISISQMRELERKLSLSSFLNSYKIAIIEEAETMSLEAANSLLKTLEEPTPKTVIILLSSSLAALPATIVSRCQTLKFLPVGEEKIYQYLVGQGASRDEAQNFAKASWGKPGVAIDFWQSRGEGESGAMASYMEETKGVIEIMRADTLTGRMRVFEKYFAKDKATEDLTDSLNKILSLWRSILRDAALVKTNCPEMISNQIFFEDIKKIAKWSDISLFPKLYRGIGEASRCFGDNFNPRLVLENLMLSF
jgi:DNA polymerase-3 subunit delta'